MKIDVLNIDKLIELNNLKEVTSPRPFNTKTTYDPDGLLSTEIFGSSKGDRRTTFAYINLRQHFIHPHIYEKVLKSIYKNIIYIISGRRRFVIRNGLLVEDNENGWTGLQNLYDHWDEILWEKSASANKVNKKLLTGLTRDQVFIDKMIVCPPAFRDVILSGTMDSSDHVNELNTLYERLIRMVSILGEGGLLSRNRYATQSKIQDILGQIMIYFKNQISKKHGLIKKNLIGKSVDYGSRIVISSPVYNNNKIEDNMIDFEHCAFPISQCISNFRPFIDAWVLNFFTQEIINDPNLIMFIDPETGKEMTAPIKDPDIQFSEKKIGKMIDDYSLNPDNRFKVIKLEVSIPTANGEKIVNAVMKLKGKVLFENNVMKELNRPLTITDVLYLACVDTCEKRHVMISRYPVGTDKGITFSKLRVQSTTNHIHVIYNGKHYPYYPDIDLSIEHDNVGIQFIDTLVISNSHLDGMGADYDGDVLSARGIWSDEANIEAEQIMNSKISVLNITGGNSKGVSKEVFNSLYELTKNGKNSRTITLTEQNELLNIKFSDISLSMLTSFFADTVDNSVKNNIQKRPAKFKTWDRMTIPAKYFYDEQPKIDTTVGRFIANKFILEGSGAISIVHYVNDILNKGSIEALDSIIATLYLKNHIERKVFNTYTDRRDTLGYWLNGMLAHTMSPSMCKPLPEIEKEKEILFKKYEKELLTNNIDVMTNISDKLIKDARALLKDDPGIDLYDSGDLSFNVNYKNNAILKGAVINKITGEYDFIGSSFMNGIEIKDIAAHSNSILASQFPASIATANAGYLGKRLQALLQMMEIGEPESDCGTKNLIPINITKKNKGRVIYSYIDNGGGQLELLTEENISNYIGKTVKMRSPMSCKNDKICSICSGKLFEYLDIKHAGLFGVQISHADLNLALKAKHVSVVTLHTLNPDTIIENID